RGQRALAIGAITRAAPSAAAAVAGAELVVLAAPVGATPTLCAAIAPALDPRALVTDLGSTKRQVLEWARALLPDAGQFVGGHPMVGRERSGIDASDVLLYTGAVWCLTPDATTAPDTLTRVRGLVRALGAVPLALDATRHDSLVAAVSHLPLMAATALMATVASDPAWPDAQRLAAGGLRDTTRVASGDPIMARDICLTNAAAIVGGLDGYISRLARLRDAIAAYDGDAIERVFSGARDARDQWLETRDTPPQNESH
ncbi:MAG: prephenate dehydrogenase, partial [Ktedonobacterales bacterium]